MEPIQSTSEDELVTLVLAAGSSSRMGQSKQLIEIKGQPLLQKVVDVVCASKLGKIVVVLGAYYNDHQEILKDKPVDIVFHSAWQNGIGSSLKAGVAYIQKTYSNAKGVIITVCDQPYLTPNHLINLIESHRATGKPIVASSYTNTIGVPCFFQNTIVPSILKLSDNEGAKKLLSVFSNEVAIVDFPMGEIDLDTPEDLSKIQKSL